MTNITPYNGDKKVLITFMEELQDYLIKVDPLQRLHRLAGYGEKYVDNLLQKVKEHGGIIYIATSEQGPVGMVAGVNAHAFYRKVGYEDRSRDMMKVIS